MPNTDTSPTCSSCGASQVVVVISLLGLALACAPGHSCARGLLTGLYLCLGVPSWVFLVFVSVTAIALRDDAEVRDYEP